MRIVAVAGGVCLLAVLGYLLWGAGGGADGKPLVFRHLSRVLSGRRSLELKDSPFNTRWQYPLEVKSNVRKPVKLDVRYEGEGEVKVLLAGTKLVSRQATEKTTLIVVPANKVGPFAGRVTIFSPDLPEWEGEVFQFTGNVDNRGLTGKYLRPRPGIAIALGDLRPGEEKLFSFEFESFGSEPVTISSITASEPQIVRLKRDAAQPHTVVAGEPYVLGGKCVAPTRAGPFRVTIHVFSDTSNFKGALGLYVSGQVVPDYAPIPAALRSNIEYPMMERVHIVKIKAREGLPPFRVAAVERNERYFDVESKGGDQPAMEQQVRLKVRRDAPTNPAETTEFNVLFRLEPGGTEIVVPVRMRFYGRIHATPLAINFGTNPTPREIRVDAFSGHVFKVTNVRSERGRFDVRLLRERQGMAPIIHVSIPNGTPAGVLQDRVVIETDDPDQPRLIVPVRAVAR